MRPCLSRPITSNLLHLTTHTSKVDPNEENWHKFKHASYVGYVKGNERLGIPDILMNDGPQGFRDEKAPGSSTAFPSVLSLGASWDRDLCRSFGVAMGEEFYGKGANVLLGPGMNLARVPTNGRAFEYVSGGDPHLGYVLVGPIIKGIQSQGVVANAKHWVQNNQETNRATVNEVVDERTQHELYYQPFEGAVEAGVGSFMCSYNKINGLWSCENPQSLEDLKTSLGFEGWVMSDWGATHSTSIEAGLDQQMPGQSFFGEKLLEKVKGGDIPEATVDDSVMRILTPMYEMGIFDKDNTNDVSNVVTSPEHSELAKEIASSSTILLKNEDSTLPLDATKNGLKIALIGQMARNPIISGGGSGEVYPSHVSTPYQGILGALGIPMHEEIPVAVNCTETLVNIAYEQSSCISYGPTTFEDCEKRCANYVGCIYYSYTGGHCLFSPSSAGKKPIPRARSGQCVKTPPTPSWQCNDHNVCLIVSDGSDVEEAKKLAAQADVVVLPIGTTSGEGSDRPDLTFARHERSCQLQPEQSQDDLVSAVSAVAKKTIVAMVAPGAVLTPWADSVDSLLLNFLPGQEYGSALADVLFGAVNPTGHLPLSLPNKENEVEFTESQFPGVDKTATYSEGMLIDYRWYTANSVKPAFPFGHGLSYTTFEYEELVVASDGREVTASVKNTGSTSGSATPQMYLTFPASANTPPLQLKGFVKTSVLQPGEKEKVSFALRDRDLSTWNVDSHKFVLAEGEYTVCVGASSADLALKSKMTI